MERSPWTLAMMTATLLLVGVALALPWYSFHHSTGRQTPPGSESTDDGVEERHILYRPFVIDGDGTPEQREEAKTPILTLGVLAAVPVVFAVLNLLLETFWGIRERTRLFQLVLTTLGFLTVGAALVYTWLVFPVLLKEEGVSGAFTTRNDQGTFIRSTLSWGWTLAALSLIPNVATFALKYAGGVFTLSFLEQYRSERTR